MNTHKILQHLDKYYFSDEQDCIDYLLSHFKQSSSERKEIETLSLSLIKSVRENPNQVNLFQNFMQTYSLTTQEGVILMCLAESLLRIPDTHTANQLIEDKLGGATWEDHLGASTSFWVNASAWGLMLTGKWMRFTQGSKKEPTHLLKRLIAKSGEPVIRGVIKKAMGLMGSQFVMGETISEAIQNAALSKENVWRYSFDMLGEAALTQKDADRFYQSYLNAIEALGALPEKEKAKVSISIKLSALHPRYEVLQTQRVYEELVPALLRLVTRACALNVPVTIDAEESARLALSLEIFEKIIRHPALSNWHGLGLAIQAYQKRAIGVVDWISLLAKNVGKIIPVRLVKGAYWDSEIKRAQQLGLENYPLFTQKAATDLCYLICAQKLLKEKGIFPQFATHNAHTMASIFVYAKTLGCERYEFQRLHGMGEPLYEALAQLSQDERTDFSCRIYAPVGDHKELLPYLIRRLLENGANTSFVNHLLDKTKSEVDLVLEPADVVLEETGSKIPLPPDIFLGERKNSIGFDLNATAHRDELVSSYTPYLQGQWVAAPWVNGMVHTNGPSVPVQNPANRNDICGHFYETSLTLANEAVMMAHEAFSKWREAPVYKRADILLGFSELLEKNRGVLLALLIREAGKTLKDALGEIREAVDFCRYYAVQGKLNFEKALFLPGPTGEENYLSFSGRGVFLAISPWNFPLAIFVGQISAALMAGNTVIAKPAEQTSLMASFVTTLFYEAGVPPSVLHCLPGDGHVLGNYLTKHEKIAGVVFTGSTDTAKQINKNLSERSGPIVPLIAETGGLNAMIVDSSALAEQVVLDVLESAFNSAGQRCSALRVLFLQTDIADHVLELLVGGLSELSIGSPSLLTTDIGPVIDTASKIKIEAHLDDWRTSARFFYQHPISSDCQNGHFVGPAVIEIDALSSLADEIFGPVLHIIKFSATELSSVIDSINQAGFGLTLGIHSRIETTVLKIQSQVRVGNIYVNRNMIGAVVGVQPFGGQGLSGTGPKAGGPHYLQRFATEQTITINTAAIGGNVKLLTG